MGIANSSSSLTASAYMETSFLPSDMPAGAHFHPISHWQYFFVPEVNRSSRSKGPRASSCSPPSRGRKLHLGVECRVTPPLPPPMHRVCSPTSHLGRTSHQHATCSAATPSWQPHHRMTLPLVTEAPLSEEGLLTTPSKHQLRFPAPRPSRPNRPPHASPASHDSPPAPDTFSSGIQADPRPHSLS